MSKDNTGKNSDLLAAELALGSLEGEALRRAEARLSSDRDFETDFGRWSDILSAFSELTKTSAPPENLFNRIDSAIDEIENAPENTVTLRGDESDWLPMAEGVDCRRLWLNEEIGRQTLLIRMAPGATYESHRHEGLEECYVVSGDLAFGSHQLRAGDFHAALPGSHHPTASSKCGCLLLISAAA